MDDTTLTPTAAPHPSASRPYHHGDLRNAVIEAALSLLAEKGVEGVTLRQCAARAGVSHGAPGHHFGDLKGVLTAIAVVGFEELVGEMESALAREPRQGADRIAAMGAGYVRFALTHRAHFSLMFQRDRLRGEDLQLRRATEAAYGLLAREAARWVGGEHPQLRRLRDAIWSIVHGYAALIISGQIAAPADLDYGVRNVLAALTDRSA